MKRLCRLVRHTLQYASDCFEPARRTLRLQVEYDSLFLRCGQCLYEAGAQGLGAWQFLAVLPFHTITSQTLWRFYVLLHKGTEPPIDSIANYKKHMLTKEVRSSFEERLCVMGVEESYYLLNAFANMIIARTLKDFDFIQFATINLVQIGFVGATQESCSKCAAILLNNITSRYPALISHILQEIKESIEQAELILYLFRELPLHLWRITESDLNVLSVWLLQRNFTSVENHLARLILSNLNWGFDGAGVMFLGADLHVRAALLVAETVSKCGSGLNEWAWRLVYRLKLHVTDRGVTDVSHVPELSRFEFLAMGVRAQQPLCSYLALMMTTTGHLIPMVCSHGFTQLQLMLSAQAYEPVVVALYSIVPLFLDCPESLVVSPQFQEILSALLAADKSYVKMAKSLISNEFPGLILKQFSWMVECQIHNPRW